MGPKPVFPQSAELFRQTLREQINLKHPLLRLADLIDWGRIGTVCAKNFPSGRGPPVTSPRLIAGLLYLQLEPPIDPSSLTRWRARLGEEGIEELPAATIAAGRRSGTMRKSSLKTVIVDTTVMPKAVARTKRILKHRSKDKNKLYALHASEVECISKGKARTPYEFGVKVSMTTTLKEGFVVGARSMPVGGIQHWGTSAQSSSKLQRQLVKLIKLSGELGQDQEGVNTCNNLIAEVS